VSIDAATRGRLVGVFVAEADETVASLRQLAARLAQRPDPDALREFERIAHGLKGASAALGYEALARVLHDLEELALGVEEGGTDGRPERLDRIRTALDLLGEGTGRMGASGADAFPEDLLESLRHVVSPAARSIPIATPTATATATPVPVAASSATQPLPAPPPGPSRTDSCVLGEVGGEEGIPRPTARAPAEGDPARAASRTAEAAERISVPASDVDAALRLASSLARSTGQHAEALQRAGGEFAERAQSLAVSAGGLEAIVASLRLLPADSALSGLEEEVAALAAQLGKAAALSVTGRDVRADRRTLQAARGMIRHLVRNALDHGIEPPAARAAARKPEEGHLSVTVTAGESTLRVVVGDDGAGFDGAAIREELARRTGDPERAASLSDEEVLRVWAFEGGSTRASATQISGRGLGLSAVAQMARAAGGGIRIQSVRGEGSVVEFTLPLEVYAVEALTVTTGGRRFGIPLAAVERTVHLSGANGAIHDGPSGRTLALGETILPLGALAEALGFARASSGGRFAIVVRSEGALAALLVDEVGAVEGMVPSSVPGVAEADALVTGVARLGDGSPVALLNPRLLLAGARARRAAPDAPESRPLRGARMLEVVLAEDSLATREVLRVLLEEQGFRVRVAADGEEALQRVAEQTPDVVVSDINMPHRDGLSLTRALRCRPGTERLPIVLLTSQDDDAMRAAGAAAGADAYLLKSRFNADVLHDALARIGLRGR
jgi:two-component system chemotaxis sensor kinase CheA